MELVLYKEDIYKIGDIVPYDGNVGIVIKADEDNEGIKEILLRNILKTFGEEYHILSVNDYAFEDINDVSTIIELVFVTNLPVGEIEKLGDIC